MINAYPVIFTDLDGTLLDSRTYSWAEAEPALAVCRQIQAPVVFVSSKTRVEIVELQREIGIFHPFVSENGGGAFFPKSGMIAKPEGAVDDGDFWKLSLGKPYPVLCDALASVSLELGFSIVGFSQMTPGDIAELTGLTLEKAVKAADRDFDEPFIIKRKSPVDENELRACVRNHGLELSVGGRFFHIHGVNDKAFALDKVTSCYKLIASQVVTAALGDSQNDFSMLKRADYGIYVGALSKNIPSVRKSLEPGPAGWNFEVLKFLREIGVRGIP